MGLPCVSKAKSELSVLQTDEHGAVPWGRTSFPRLVEWHNNLLIRDRDRIVTGARTKTLYVEMILYVRVFFKGDPMKNLTLVLIALTSLVGCTQSQVTCTVQNTLVGAMSQGIAASLQCANTSAIAATLNTAAAGLKMCPASSATTLSLPASFCQPLVDILVGSVAANAIPAAWGCTAQVAQGAVSGVLMNACTGGPVIQASPSAVPSPMMLQSQKK